jgi:hypothetical protein
MKLSVPAALLAACATLATLPSPAQAADGDPSLKQFALGTLSRARRAVAIGPTVGMAVPVVVEDGGDVDFTLSFGLGLYFFRVPVLPDPASVKDMVMARVKEKVQDHVKAMIAEGKPAPTEAELEAYARQIFEEVKAEILGQLERRNSYFEKPRAGIDMEYTTIFGADSWQIRVTGGFAVGPVTLGPSFSWDATGDGVARLAPQLDWRVLLGRGPRAPVVDVFLRWDFSLYDRAIQPDQLTLGARFMLDII